MRNGRKKIDMNFPVLHSQRCQITIATKRDADWLYALFNDETVYKYIEGIRPFAKTIEHTMMFIDYMLDAYIDGRGFLWKLSRQGKPIGFISVLDFDENPSLCYALYKSNRNNGLMHEALESVLLFQNRIEKKTYRCDINAWNFPSISLCKKLKESFPIYINTVYKDNFHNL